MLKCRSRNNGFTGSAERENEWFSFTLTRVIKEGCNHEPTNATLP